MRPCFNSYCLNGKEIFYLDDDTQVVTDKDCYICEGTGEVEDGCYCNAYEPNECMCGAWDDISDWWYCNQDIYDEENKL